MLVTLFLMVVAYSAVVASFSFRDNCVVRHLRSRSFATCNACENEMQKDLYLNESNTAYLDELQLLCFENVTFDSAVQVNKITIKKTAKVSLAINNSALKDLSVDMVDDLTLRQLDVELNTGTINSLSLTNVKKLRLVNEGEFFWPIRSVTLLKVKDIDLVPPQLNIFATNFTVVECNIDLNGSVLILKADSAIIDDSVLYIHKNGHFNVTANHFLVRNTTIDLKYGAIHLINSKEVTFSGSSFYNFEAKSLSLSGLTSVKLVESDIFTSDIGDVLHLNRTNVMFKYNTFDCTDCAVNRKLKAIDLGEVGKTNNCYVSCALTLNLMKVLMDNRLCHEGEVKVDNQQLCTVYEKYISETVTTDGDLLQLVLFISIPLVLIISLLFCICHKDNYRKLKCILLRNFLPRELECEKKEEQGIVFNNDSYDCHNKNDHVYEPVDSPVGCK